MESTQIQTRASFLARINGALRRLGRDRRGATTVEYLVLIAFVALAGIAAMDGLSKSIGDASNAVGGKVKTLDKFK